MKKRIITVILTVVLILSLVPSALAADSAATSAADALYSAGLFRGVGTNPNGTPNYDLDRTMNRYEGMTMLVRLLGAEGDATTSAQNLYPPFNDVVQWAKPYVGYAYRKGLTKGISETRFGGAADIKTSEYLTFICRALGYSDSIDFAWDSAWTLTDRIGVTHGEYRTNSAFSRSDAVKVSLAALRAKMKNSDLTLIEQLYVNGAVSEKAVCDILGISGVSAQLTELSIYNKAVGKHLVFIDSMIGFKDLSQKEFTDRETVLLLPDSTETNIFDFHSYDISAVASISDVERSVKKLFGKTIDVRNIQSSAIRIAGDKVILPARTGVGIIEAELISVTALSDNDYAITFNYRVGTYGSFDKYKLTINCNNGNVVYKCFERANYN